MITQAKLKKLLNYDPATGVFRWRVSRGTRSAGSVAGSLHPNGYNYIGIGGDKAVAHRLAWFYVTGAWPREEIDHINGVKNDNRIDNLRAAARVENMRNYPKPINNTSGHKGVSWHAGTGKWTAQIQVSGVKTYLGLFRRLTDAAAAYVKASKRFHKDFGRLS